MDEIRILLAGSRTWPRGVVLPDVLRRVGESALLHADRVLLRHGACPDGADAEAHELWTSWGWPTDPVPAMWEECGPECVGLPPSHRKVNRRRVEYCPGAGMRRNAELVARGADRMLAFVASLRSPGTQGCVRLALAAGIPVWEYWPDGAVIEHQRKFVSATDPLW